MFVRCGVPSVLPLLLLASLPAAAQTVTPHTTSGDVAEVDRATGTLVLEDGERYAVSDPDDLGTVAEGDPVEIEYRILGDQRVAVRVIPPDVAAAEE
ncbi:DUF1344 domain-containing protein [Azospirillum sp. A39]|uniref:DUF1344 domain-containing protein n=1 Tax=Azospirillum sp. A39 TaxID=3462279 RepID=UPI004045F5B2